MEGGGATLLLEDPKAAAKYLKQGAKPSDVPEFLREYKEVRLGWAGWLLLGVVVNAVVFRCRVPALVQGGAGACLVFVPALTAGRGGH